MEQESQEPPLFSCLHACMGISELRFILQPVHDFTVKFPVYCLYIIKCMPFENPILSNCMEIEYSYWTSMLLLSSFNIVASSHSIISRYSGLYSKETNNDIMLKIKCQIFVIAL